jgi:hypothetical protein
MATKRNNQFAIAFKPFLLVLLILGVLLGSRRTAHAASFSFTTIDIPFPDVACGDINSNGQIVGVYVDGPVMNAFLDDHGALTMIDFPGAIVTAAIGIKPGGQIIIGFYVDNKGVNHGFLDDKGVFTTVDVPFPGATGTQLIAINPSGQIVGLR